MRLMICVCVVVPLSAPVVSSAQLETAFGDAQVISNAQYWDHESNQFPDTHDAYATAPEILAMGFDASLAAESGINAMNRGFSTGVQHTIMSATTITSSASVSSGWVNNGGAFLTAGSAASRMQIIFDLPAGGHYSFPKGLFTQQVFGIEYSVATILRLQRGDDTLFEAYEGDFGGAEGDLGPGQYALRFELYTNANNFGPSGSRATLDFEFRVVPPPGTMACAGVYLLTGVRRRRG
jgi:hypothetical protein